MKDMIIPTWNQVKCILTKRVRVLTLIFLNHAIVSQNSMVTPALFYRMRIIVCCYLWSELNVHFPHDFYDYYDYYDYVFLLIGIATLIPVVWVHVEEGKRRRLAKCMGYSEEVASPRSSRFGV